jgi:hypothetical protein
MTHVNHASRARSFPWGSLLGTLLALAGVSLLYLLVSRHEAAGLAFWASVALIALGCYLVQPMTMDRLIVTIAPYVPVVGGQRAGDPPAPAAPAPGVYSPEQKAPGPKEEP